MSVVDRRGCGGHLLQLVGDARLGGRGRCAWRGDHGWFSLSLFFRVRIFVGLLFLFLLLSRRDLRLLVVDRVTLVKHRRNLLRFLFLFDRFDVFHLRVD